MPARDQASQAGAATMPAHRGALAWSAIGSWVPRVAAATALGIVALIHWQNASAYDAVTATISQGQLFRAEAAAIGLAGLGLLTHRKRPGMQRLLPMAARARKRG